ncbi:Glucose--fructose oxidoreductase precursor [Pirellula sp. SH-Sr6A]|uniref:Gfo/Idh/MocA family protein n=1 Tax=Pirellula sp. SH-Sr6A TaxID=1632865 RepID=UPI00078CC324|nr:Gfo/Idh/MocA family oxidoreductase [Pirellula sp. SH-Sr6A]AMV35176.1 Glucose--fructose oxidoreductase precursor [Pirellula sp. SH-Sr6A]
MNQLTPDEKNIGQNNFHEAVGFTRREFMQGVVAAGAVSGAGLGAMYFGYNKVNDPVRVGVIGVGDEGNVLIGGCNPDYVTVKAIADIRPFGIHRAFHGDWASPAANSARPGLIKQYKYSSEDEARKNVKVYDATNGGIDALLKDEEIEAVIIALPLHLHAPIAVKAMQAKKHVLTEKLMAHNVAQCKVMARISEESTDQNGHPIHLATGHQRHYSVLYDNAVHLLKWGMIGQLHHIRAQWHRGNLPGKDSWQPWLPGGEIGLDPKQSRVLAELTKFKNELEKAKSPAEIDLLTKKVAQWEAWMKDIDVDAEKFGYINKKLGDRDRPAIEELVRWRIFERTGGGLMAELGSHQLDAATIFCSALRSDGKKAHPLTVHALGGRHIFPFDRECDDHVYCSFEFPGPEYSEKFDAGYTIPGVKGIPGYDTDPNKKIVVTYSSINGNGYGGYGEVVMGTKGTMIIDKEQEVMLYAGSDTGAAVGVKAAKGGYALDTQASGGSSAPIAKAASNSGPVSRGYTEEIEHWAYCIRNPDPANRPKCYPEVAMADAVIALTTNVAMRKGARGEAGFVKFEESWFDVKSDDTPDGSNVSQEMDAMRNYKIDGGTQSA